VHYSSGVWGLGSLSVAHTLPTGDLLWLIARVLLDLAGGLFLLYMVLMSGLSLWCAAPRRSADRPGGPAHRSPARTVA
jgi:hypothetical protein